MRVKKEVALGLPSRGMLFESLYSRHLAAPYPDVRLLLVSFTAETGFVTFFLHLDSMLCAVFLSHV